jgi:hypothetical protein
MRTIILGDSPLITTKKIEIFIPVSCKNEKPNYSFGRVSPVSCKKQNRESLPNRASILFNWKEVRIQLTWNC